MYHNKVEFSILVKGRRIDEYNHRGQVFIEGRDGSEYEIEVRNNSSQKIEAVISVDGLSVIDGKSAGPNSSGYLIEPLQTIKIPGWKLNDSNIAKFAFSTKGESYASKISNGESRNNGVIGVMAFSEKPTPTYLAPPDFLRGRSVNTSLADNGWIASSAKQTATTTSVNSLGTAFGESAEFKTTNVEFKRGDMLSMMVVYYDDARGLKARGIEVSKPKNYQQPDAFPAMSEGCVPPTGWNG